MTDTVKDLIDRRNSLEGLKAHPGWAIFIQEALEMREVVRSATEDRPCTGLDDAMAEQFSKGRSYQLKMLAGVPDALIDNLTAEIQSLLTQAGALSDVRTTDPDSDTDRGEPLNSLGDPVP